MRTLGGYPMTTRKTKISQLPNTALFVLRERSGDEIIGYAIVCPISKYVPAKNRNHGTRVNVFDHDWKFVGHSEADERDVLPAAETALYAQMAHGTL